MEESEYTRQRIDMVNRQLKSRGISHPQVLDAFLSSLTDQLAEGGKLIIPAGDRQNQKLYLITKLHGRLIQKESIQVKFVPMIHT